MKKHLLIFSFIFLSTSLLANPTSIPQQGQIGVAAKGGAKSGLMWGAGMGSAAAFASAFGLIAYLTSTDSTSFGHSHSHSHSN